MNDATLEQLVKLRASGETLPSTVTIRGQAVETRRFLQTYRHDYRDASPAIACYITAIERPLMCEAALALGNAERDRMR